MSEADGDEAEETTSPDRVDNEENRLRLLAGLGRGRTEIVMGRGLKAGAKSAFNSYDGFNLHTEGRYFVDTDGNAIYQSTGRMIFKAVGDDTDLYALAGRDAVLGGVRTAAVIGADSAFLLASRGLRVKAEDGDRDAQLSDDGKGAANKVLDKRKEFLTAFMGIDAVVGVGLAGLATYDGYRTVRDKAGWARVRKSAQLGFGGLATAAAGVVSALGAGSALGGTAIFGEAGTLIGSCGFVATYAFGGTLSAGATVTQIGVDVSTLALSSASIKSLGTASVHGARRASLHSGRKTTVTAGGFALTGKAAGVVEIDAGEIHIGTREAMSPTKTILLVAGAKEGASLELTEHGSYSGVAETIELVSSGPQGTTIQAIGAGSLSLEAATSLVAKAAKVELKAESDIALNALRLTFDGKILALKGDKVQIG